MDAGLPCGRGSAMWTRVSRLEWVCRVDGDQQCGRGSAVWTGSAMWMGVSCVDRVCCVDIGRGLACGRRSDVRRTTVVTFPLFQQYSRDDPFSQAKNCHKF